MAARHKEGYYPERKSIHKISCARHKGLTIDDFGVSRDTTVSREIRPGAGFETGDFDKEKLGGGATVERLIGAIFLFFCKIFLVLYT